MIIKYTVEYDKLELLAPQHRSQLLADLRQRTGIDLIRVQIQSIDLLSAKATLNAWYDDPDATGDSVEFPR